MKKQQYPRFVKLTYKRCMDYLRDPSERNKDLLIYNLTRWSTFGTILEDYGYEAETEESLYNQISYCSDRMNMGRAKALLRLFQEN